MNYSFTEDHECLVISNGIELEEIGVVKLFRNLDSIEYVLSSEILGKRQYAWLSPDALASCIFVNHPDQKFEGWTFGLHDDMPQDHFVVLYDLFIAPNYTLLLLQTISTLTKTHQ